MSNIDVCDEIQQICINVTNRCNNRCIYCFTHPNDKDMDLQTAKDAIQYAWDHRPSSSIELSNSGYHPVFINWFGGEPMLKFEDVIKPAMIWAKEQGYDIGWGISTNAELLTPERLKFFEYFHTGVLFSIDGIEQVQNEQRPLANGKPSWPLLKDNLELFARYPWGSIFRSTIPALHPELMFKGYLLAREYGFNEYYCGMVYEDKNWTDEKFDQFLESAFSMSYTMYSDITHGRHVTVIQPLLASITDYLMNDEDKIRYSNKRCGLGTNTAGITPDGKIVGCQEHGTYDDPDDIFLIGDIYNGIDFEKRQRLLDMYEEGFKKADSNEKCQTCKFKANCFISNCPSMSLRAMGGFGEINPSFCKWREIWDKCATIIIGLAASSNNEPFKQWFQERFPERK